MRSGAAGGSTLARLEQAIAAWLDRRTAFLTRPGAVRAAMLLVPLLFGLVSLGLGQDENWDLKNYHLYNAYSLMNGRLGFDLAPGQWQSYFNPTLDLLYYGLLTALPAPLAGVAMGVLHGLNFLLVLGIARMLLPPPAAANASDRYRLPLLLAFAGMLGAGFLSGVGNSMGDNMSALFVLASLYLVLANWPRWTPAGPQGRGGWNGGTLALLLAAGLVMGLGTGLKLTNATYALALCVALLVLDGGFWHRIRLAFCYGVGVLAGIAIAAGHWFWTMWQTFGNPLFPQFNKLFHGPLAAQFGVLDLGHVPQSWVEAVFWPFIFTLHFDRVSEVPLKETVWPITYLLFLALGVKLLLRWRGRATPAAAATPAPLLAPRQRFTLVFFVLGYLGWLKLFGIYRYLVPLELLTPLVVWLLLHALLRTGAARVAGRWLLLLVALATFPFVTWGHTPWAREAFSVSDPGLADPAASVFYTVHADPPLGWMVKYLPPQLRVMSLGSGFPESPEYVARVRAIAASRPGPHYVMLAANANQAEAALVRKIALVRGLGLTGSAGACERLDWWIKRVRFHVQVQPQPPQDGQHCTLVVPPHERPDLQAKDRVLIDAAVQTLGRYGITLYADSCRVHPAAIGAAAFPYQLCRVTESAGAAAAPR
jgi:hypothetical protein